MTSEPKPGGPFHRSLAARLRSWFFTAKQTIGVGTSPKLAQTARVLTD